MTSSRVARLLLLAGFTLATVQAASITYSGDDPYRSYDITFSATYFAGDQLLNGQIATSTQTMDVDVIAGVANLLIDGLYTVDAVCVDFFVLISDGTYDMNLLGPNGVGAGRRITWMLRNTLPTINTQSDPLLKRQQAAALQLAVWDVVHDNGDGFLAGRIQQGQQTPTDAIVLSWANAYLTASVGRMIMSGTVYQNVAGATVTQRLMSDTVPEPSTYGMLALGTLALGLAGRRRRVS